MQQEGEDMVLKGTPPSQMEFYRFLTSATAGPEDSGISYTTARKKGVYAKKVTASEAQYGTNTVTTVVPPSETLPSFAFASPWTDSKQENVNCLVAVGDFLRVNKEANEVYSITRPEFSSSHDIIEAISSENKSDEFTHVRNTYLRVFSNSDVSMSEGFA